MPLYEFRCQDCEEVFEVRRSFVDAEKSAVCPTCHTTNTKKRLTVTHFITSTKSIPVPMSSGSGCGCGGSCACQH